ncbi:avidin-like [Zonotrichia leucophrys gambelii]|uniref:avidin-like n=1 Tax=Zonotrichia leucophrys gambelii TaxID=257770 RepID=UPI0031405994
MVQATPLLLVLFLALGAHSLQATQQCSLTGRWVNDLGSKMNLSPVDKNGGFTGTYRTAVTATSNKIKESPLQGSMQRNPNQKGQPTFGFTVNWSFSDSITVFTGQCFVDDNGEEVLKTMWLLRSHEDSIKNDWKATRVGFNVFTRPKPLE